MSNAAIMLTDTTPAKVAQYLRKAHDRGLVVDMSDRTYVISSPNPIDDSQLWLYFTPGARGGSLTIVRYLPTHRQGRRKDTKKLTRREAAYWIDDMGDALDRHHARQAAPQAARVTAVQHPQALGNAQAATGTQPAAELAAEAQAVLATLKVNGRFALRMARTGAIPRTTTGTVRQALVNRGLVSQAGGALTDLGKAVRELVMA